MTNVIGRLIEFGAVLGISALIAFVLHSSVAGLGSTVQEAVIVSWGSFFVIPMIYYRLLHYNGGHGRS